MSRSQLVSIICILLVWIVTGCAVDGEANSPPDWEQVNAPDMVSDNQWITALQVFKGQLYAASSKVQSPSSPDSAVYRSSDGTHWSKIEAMSFKYQQNFHFGVLKGKLYVGGTNPGKTLNNAELWRSADGSTWETITADGFGDITNNNVYAFAEYWGMVYAATANTLGAQVWRSRNGDRGTWQKVFSTKNPHAIYPTSLYVYGGRLYAAIDTDWEKHFELWRTGDGLDWRRVGSSTFEPADVSPSNLVAYKKALYMGLAAMKVDNDSSSGVRIDYPTTPCLEMPAIHIDRLKGAQLWRSTDGARWTRVLGGGMGDVKNWKFESLVIYEGDLYAVLDGLAGLTVWRSPDGLNWTKVSEAGFGDKNNATGHWMNGTAIYHGQLYLGTTPFPGTGDGEIWRTVKE
jgi:hypothetical protein